MSKVQVDNRYVSHERDARPSGMNIDPILVSFCNVKSRTASRLAVFDPLNETLTPLCLPESLPKCMGATGLIADERYIYVATQMAQSPQKETSRFLLTFDRKKFSLFSTYCFRQARDVHSLCWYKGKAMVVSSGTDEIVEVAICAGEVRSETLYWRVDPEGTRRDHHHLSGICAADEGLIVCGFGKKRTELWSSATEGFLCNLNLGSRIVSDLHQPHTVTRISSSIVYCESRKMAVRSRHGAESQILPGYTRGMCLSGSNVFVATSIGRKQSRSTGVVENFADSGLPCEGITINRLDPDTLTILSSVAFASEGEEVFDLLPIDDAWSWPMGAPRIAETC
jgi:hypothetical protein